MGSRLGVAAGGESFFLHCGQPCLTLLPQQLLAFEGPIGGIAIRAVEIGDGFGRMSYDIKFRIRLSAPGVSEAMSVKAAQDAA